MATIRIENLRLRTIIGIYDWERENKQDIIINAKLTFDASKASQSDDIKDTVNYKEITKTIIEKVEPSSFNLLEKLTKVVLEICLINPLVTSATVRIDKPQALRFADSVSIELTEKQQ
jgi:D-erythro-7,8-dihydroneopterin triphosphate epimerase